MQISQNSESATIGHNVTSSVLNDLWEELLIKHEACWARVVSNSMYPALKHGVQVLVERASPDEVRFGDIIVFKRNGRLTIHRVLGKREYGGECHFLEKGDANLQSSLVPTKEIIGRVSIIRTPGKPLPVISGSGRWLQLTLACISYTSIRLRSMLQHRLIRRRHIARKHGYGSIYNRFFSWLRRIALRLFS